MNGKDNIINKILADADLKCAEILATAESEAQEIADSARLAMQAETQALDKRLQSLAVERERNAMASADLDARKYKLNKKQQLITACYDKALDVLIHLPDKKKLELIGKILTTYAEKGETVLVARADKDIVTQKFLDSLNLGLKLGSKTVDAVGGVVLVGPSYDKDLTFPVLLAYSREQTEARVAAVLFGEDK